jgi:thiamine-phosphate pyrophosphorylase
MLRADLLAKRRRGSVVEPLDLLAALASEPETRASELLVELGVEIDRLWDGLGPELSLPLAALKDDPAFIDETSSAHSLLPVSPALRLVLNEATISARGSDRKRELGTGHLLAGLLSTSGPAADLLQVAGLEIQTLRQRLTEAVEVDVAPLPPAEGIPPLELNEAGGVELGRILDASANRAREGLRVIEDYVRFVLDDPGLTRRLKQVRHRLAEAERGLDEKILIG